MESDDDLQEVKTEISSEEEVEIEESFLSAPNVLADHASNESLQHLNNQYYNMMGHANGLNQDDHTSLFYTLDDASLYYNSILQNMGNNPYYYSPAQQEQFLMPNNFDCQFWNIHQSKTLQNRILQHNSSNFQSPPIICDIGVFDIVELKFLSLHPMVIDADDWANPLMNRNRTTVRIIGVVAGESLHNLYRIIMAALGQQEDRARLVFHCWIFDRLICGSGPKLRPTCKQMVDDKTVFLNGLPLMVGYSFHFVFGKCLYQVTVEDVICGMTDENDLTWMPRLIDGSYGESCPFDLCYSPSLFGYRPTSSDLHVDASISSDVDRNHLEKSLFSEIQTLADLDNKKLSREVKKNPHLCAKYREDRYLSSEELDSVNRQLMSMKFIRQNSGMKTTARRIKAHEVIPDIWKRMHWFRFSPRRFFYLLWNEQASGQTAWCTPDHLPSSLSATAKRVYAASGVKTELEEICDYVDSNGCGAYQSEGQQFGPYYGDDTEEELIGSSDSPPPLCRYPKSESSRFRRRKKNALAALECFSTSSLYHPFYGYVRENGPRVRVSKREGGDRLMVDREEEEDEEDEDEEDEEEDEDMNRTTIMDVDEACAATEAQETQGSENSSFPLMTTLPEQTKKKRGRPRKHEVRIREDPVPFKRKRGRPRKYPLPFIPVYNASATRQTLTASVKRGITLIPSIRMH